MSVLLIYPPVAKLSEPPAGIARLAGTLREHGVSCSAADLNYACMLDVLGDAAGSDGGDTWSRRASRKYAMHLGDLRRPEIYGQPARYQQAVNDLNRLFSKVKTGLDCEISLANYSETHRSPLRSSDLLLAAEQFRDNPFFASFSARLDRLLEENSPDTIGLSFSYLSQALTGFAMLGFIRETYPGISLVAGGGLITSWMNNPAWNEPFGGLVDLCVMGPGEPGLLQLAGDKEPGGWSLPDYDDLVDSDYLAPGFILPYAASDGCYWKKCSFCPDKAEDSPYIQMRPDRVKTELETLVNRYRPSLLHLLDNAVSPSVLRQLAEQPPGIPWYGFSRFEKDLEEPSFCKSLKDSGCVMLKLGLESGSPRVLEQMHKGIDLVRVSRTLENLRAAGIATYVYLLFGTPSENVEDAQLTLEFVRAHYREISFLNLAIFNMPVCSAEAADIENRFSDGDLSLYCDFVHPQGWDRKGVRTFLQKEFRRDPRIQEIIKRDPPFFTSNHAPLTCLFSSNTTTGR